MGEKQMKRNELHHGMGDDPEKLAATLLDTPFERLAGGRSRWTYADTDRVATIGHEDFCVRAAVASILSANGIPTPKVVAYGERDGLGFLVTTRVDGALIPEGTSPTRNEQYAAGELLRRIHGVAVQGYGPLNARLIGRQRTWEEAFQAYRTDSIETVRQSGHDEIADELGVATERPVQPWTSTLLHGDYHIRNILFNHENPAIIDLERVMAGHPAWDVAYYQHTSGGTDKYFSLGYGTMPAEEQVLMCAAVLWGKKLGVQTRTRPELARRTRSVLLGILERLRT